MQLRTIVVALVIPVPLSVYFFDNFRPFEQLRPFHVWNHQVRITPSLQKGINFAKLFKSNANVAKKNLWAHRDSSSSAHTYEFCQYNEYCVCSKLRLSLTHLQILEFCLEINKSLNNLDKYGIFASLWRWTDMARSRHDSLADYASW